MNIKKAFTTAELLLAMTIIGVIAMLVMPPIIKDYNTKVYSASIRSIYGDIISAIEQACIDEKVSEIGQTKYALYGQEQAFLDKYFKGQKKNAFASGYKSMNGNTGVNPVTGYSYIMLKSGAAIGLINGGGGMLHFYIDTNGKSAPNTGGLDAHAMVINKDNTLIKSGSVKCKDAAHGDNCVIELINNDWDIDSYE